MSSYIQYETRPCRTLSPDGHPLAPEKDVTAFAFVSPKVEFGQAVLDKIQERAGVTAVFHCGSTPTVSSYAVTTDRTIEVGPGGQRKLTVAGDTIKQAANLFEQAAAAVGNAALMAEFLAGSAEA